MVVYTDAIYQGGVTDTEYNFVIHRSYPLAVKTRWWSKRVSVYRRTGYYDYMQEGSFHEFPDWDSFCESWEINEKEEEE